MIPDPARAAEVLRFWRTVELFSPQDVPKVDPRHKRAPVFAPSSGGDWPWEPLHELRARPMDPRFVWQHTVYLGVYRVEAVFDVLQTIFEPDVESFDRRPPGHSALAAFIVSDDGQLLSDSLVLSTCAWATGRAITPGPANPRWLDDYSLVEEEFQALAGRLLDPVNARSRTAPTPAQDEPVHLTGDMIRSFLRATSDLLHVGTALRPSEIRVRSRRVKIEDAGQVDGNDFLNSFFIEDLSKVAAHVRTGSLGSGLARYLLEDSQIDTSGRLDVQLRFDALYDRSDPDWTPLGRWPSNIENPLALSQQVAVNAIARDLHSTSGLFAVNGPPGTGKTTMLRDLIAGIVVERAKVLASLTQPTDAFVGVTTWKTGDWTRRVSRFRPDLTGFEIVVASSNNGAVENVSDEIPGASAVDSALCQHTDYFGDLGTALLNAERDEFAEETSQRQREVTDEEGANAPRAQAWAMVAGRLGNKPNRRRFRSTFWFDERVTKNDRTEQGETPPRPGMQSILQRLDADLTRGHPTVGWADATAEFRAAQARVSRALTVRAHAHQVYKDVSAARVVRDTAAGDVSAADVAVNLHLDRFNRLQPALTTLTEQRVRAAQARVEHHSFRPGFWESFFTAGRRMRSWSAQLEQLETELAVREQELAETSRDSQAAAVDYNAAVATRRYHQAYREQADRRLADLEIAARAAQQKWGVFAPDPTWWSDKERRELRGLWLDPEANAARTELFLAALRLHKAFLANVPRQMRQSLHGAMDILSGEAPADLKGSDALTAWQSLFFVVPVMSTTFASFARVFSHLGQESLGWLLVDEAGQAAPQQAAGAIWRSKRTVVVGDPLQLEPIVTIPFRTQQAIRNSHGVSEKWLPSRTSVQQLIDETSQLGTWAGDETNPIWVGAPLVVHRRCDQPMFDIVNEIAYRGLMVNGKPPGGRYPADSAFPEAPATRWIDVVGRSADGHFIPDEYLALIDWLDKLFKTGINTGEVFVITPFRDTQRQLTELERRYGKNIRFGTVHTAQGKEANIVFLVLGSNPAKDGARAWAASKPNLLNVAVSRARRRLYVIGNREAWRHHKHFDVLARTLHTEQWHPPQLARDNP